MVQLRLLIAPVLLLLCAFALSGCGLISGELKQLFSNSPANHSGISVRATSSNGAYRAGQTITIEISFPQDVTVTGAPALKLATGRSGAEAIYISGSGTDKLLFDYTIQSGDNVSELDYLSVLALSESAGSIKSVSEPTLDLMLSSPGAIGSIAHASDIVLDTTPPTVTAVTSTTADGAYKASASVVVVANFSEPVIVTGAPEIALNSAPSSTAIYQSGSGTAGLRFDYTVGATHTTTDLNYYATNSLTLSASSIKDAAGNDAVLTLPILASASSLGGSRAIVIDTDLPSSVSSLDDGFGIVGTTSTPITTWNHATDATSSIATYQIAIGTTPGGTEVLGWTTQTAMNTATVTGLTLTAGTTYYTSVRAVDAAGNVGTGATGDGWRPVNTLMIAPATKMLVTNERYPFTASQGYPAYTYSLVSGVGSLAGNLFTAPSSAGSSVLRATDLMSSTADASITTRQFGRMPTLPPKMVDAQMYVTGMQYDSLGNLYVVGTYGNNDTRWLVMKYDGTTWTTLLDFGAGTFSNASGILVNSSTDIWVIGYTRTTYAAWTVKHFDGTTWTDSDTFSLGAFDASPAAIAKGPGGEIYVVGYANLSGPSQRWIVRQYAAGVWTTIDSYQRNGTAHMNKAQGVAVNSLGEVFVVGAATVSSYSNQDWIVRKYASGSWTNSQIIDGGSTEEAQNVAIDSSDIVYVSGRVTSSTYAVRKLSGGVWSSIGKYTDAGNTYEHIHELALDNTGRPYTVMRTSSGNHITRYSGSGTTWTSVYSTTDLSFTGFTKNPAGEMVFAGALDPYGYGNKDGEKWVIRKTDGTATTDVTSYQAQVLAPADIRSMAFDSQGNLYAVGSYRIISNSSTTVWFVKKFDGTTWTDVDEYNPVPSQLRSNAVSIYIDENDHVWVAGNVWTTASDRVWTVRKFDGTSWSVSETFGITGDQVSVSAMAGKAGKIYVVGEADNAGGWTDMVIRSFDGTSWSTAYSDDGYQIDGYFTDIIIDSNNVFWASRIVYNLSWDTEIEILKSIDGTTWTVSDTNTDFYVEWLELIEGAPGEIYVSFDGVLLASGDSVGTIRKWNGTSWSTFDQTAHDSGLYMGTRDSEGNLYFVGHENSQMMIKKWNGYYLDKVYLPTVLAGYTSEFLNVVIAGPNGKIMGSGFRKATPSYYEPFVLQLEP